MHNELFIYLLGPNQILSCQLGFVCLVHSLSGYGKNKGRISLDFSETYVPTTHVLSIIQVRNRLGNFGNCLGQLKSRGKSYLSNF